MTAPDDAPSRVTFTIGQVLAFIAALAFLLAALVVRESAILALIAFFVVSQLLLRVLILALPSVGSILLGIAAPRERTAETEAELRDRTRAAVRLCHEGSYAEALRALLAAEAIQSGDVWNALAQAWCLHKLGRLDEGGAPLERAAIHAPFEPLLHYALACHWSRAGSAPRALDSLSMAIELDPELRECAVDEPDLEPIRGEEDYSRLVDGPNADP